MYVCPNCQEEIPDRVKKANDECPFCHEPWPVEEDEYPEEPEPAASPATVGDAFKPHTDRASDHVHRAEEPPKKSKAWIGIVVLVALLGGGAGVYFGVFAGKKKGKGKGAAQTGISDTEFARIHAFYKQARNLIAEYMKPACEEAHNAGWKYYTKLVAKKRFVTEHGKRKEKRTFDIKFVPAGKASGAVDYFACPKRLAEIHRDHPFVMEMEVWERKSVFGAELKYANIEIKGKRSDYLKQKKFKSLAVQDAKNLYFPGLKKGNEDPGLRSMGDKMRFRMGKSEKKGLHSFNVSNLLFTRIKPGKWILGSWRMVVKSKMFVDRIRDWEGGCLAMRRKIGDLDKPARGHRHHDQMFLAAKKVAAAVCRSLQQIAKGIEPYNASAIESANAELLAAKNRWNTQIYKKLVELAKKVDTDVSREKPF